VPDREVEAMVDDYALRRQAIVSGLNQLGLTCHLPAGAFYAFPSVAATELSAHDFATRLLQEARVAVVPGDAFGPGGAATSAARTPPVSTRSRRLSGVSNVFSNTSNSMPLSIRRSEREPGEGSYWSLNLVNRSVTLVERAFITPGSSSP
jgi:aminotransferase